MKKFFLFALCFTLFLGTYAQTVTYQDIQQQKSAKELTGRNGGDEISAYVASNGITYKKVF